MNITIPESTQNQIAAVGRQFGFDEVEQSVSRILTRVASDDRLLTALLSRDVTPESLSPKNLEESLKQIDGGMADAANGQTVPLREALIEIAEKFDLQIDQRAIR